MILILLSFYSILESNQSGITIEINTDHLIFSRYNPSGTKGEGEISLPIGIPQAGGYVLKVMDGKIPEGSIQIKGPFNFRKHRIILLDLKENIASHGKIKVRIGFTHTPIEIKGKTDHLYEQTVINGKTSINWKILNKTKSYLTWEPSGIRLGLKEGGVYRVSSSYLSASGIVFNPPVESISLLYRGKAVPIWVHDLNDDGIFNSTDYFIFYSPPVKSDYDTLTYYWLKEGVGAGYIELSMDTTSAHFITDYMDSFYVDRDSIFSRCAGEFLYKLDTMFTFQFSDTFMMPEYPCSIKVRLFNPSSNFETLSIYVDENIVYTGLVSGNNFTYLRLENPLSPSSIVKIVTSEYSYLDRFSIAYRRKLEYSGDYFVFRADTRGKKHFVIHGCPYPDPVILRIDGYRIQPSVDEDSSGYTVSFADTIIQPSSYVVYTPGTEKKPVQVIQVDDTGTFENLEDSDILVITHPNFLLQAEEYRRLKEQDSLSVSIYTTDEIYNAFNYGEKSPYAIKSFLKYLFENTSTPPSYLFFLGKGSYDPQNILGSASDLVPVILHNTPEGYFASDYLYAFVNDDHYPDIIVGRLPCLTPSEAEGYLNKLRYGRSTSEPFENVLFFGADYALPGADVESNKLIKSIVPSGYRIVREYSREGTSIWEEVINAVNSGVSIFNFHGHGSEEDLGAGRYFRVYDIPRLNNYGKLSFMMAFTCANGVMDVPGFRSIGELSVVFPGVGMIGSIGPSGFTYFDENLACDRYYLNSLLKNGISRLGDVTYSYNFTHPNSYNSYVYLLIGDPAYEIFIPSDTLNLSGYMHGDSVTVSASVSGEGICYFTLEDSTNCMDFSVQVKNGVAETTFYYMPLSENPGLIALVKGDGILLSGETSIYRKNLFSRVVFVPDTPDYGDTLHILFMLKTLPDSAKLNWGYGSSQASYSPLTLSGDTLKGAIYIDREKSNLVLRAILFDSTGIYYSRSYSFYIRERPNLKFTEQPFISIEDTTACINLHIVNSGEEVVNTCEYSVLMYISGTPLQIYRGNAGTLEPGNSKTVKVLLPESLIARVDTLNFRVDLDPADRIDESNENDNVTYLNQLKGIFSVDQNTDTIFRYGDINIRVESGDFSSKSLLLIQETSFKVPFSQQVEPVKINGLIRTFSLSFTNLNAPLNISCVPDSSGYFYIWRMNKWVMLPQNILLHDTLSCEFPDTGTFTILARWDTIPPLLIGPTDTTVIQRETRLDLDFRIEDSQGLDLWIAPPVAIVDDDTVNLKVSLSREENLYSAELSGELEEGEHTVVIKTTDVNGNKATGKLGIVVSIPFEIIKVSNYPNPAITYTTFGFILSKPADHITLEIFQPDGSLVKCLTLDNAGSGPEFIDWDLRDRYGRLVTNGVYGYRLTAKRGIYTISKTGKMAVMKR